MQCDGTAMRRGTYEKAPYANRSWLAMHVTDGRSQDEVKKAAAVIQHSGKQRTPVSTSLRLGSHCWESLSLRFALY